MINEDDSNAQNLDVKTPSPLSSPSDQSVKGGEATAKTGSSSAESSLSEFKKRIQELPSPCETVQLCCLNPPNSRRTPRNRDAYFFYQNSANCIEEKDEPEEKELSDEAPLKRNNARARRRAKIRSQLETNDKTTSAANSVISCETARDFAVDLKSPSSLELGKSAELDSVQGSMLSAKSYPGKSLGHSPDEIRGSTYRVSSLSAGNRQYGMQKEVSTLRGGSSLPLMCLPSERVEIRPLPPLPLSKTPPPKFGGYRPLRSVVLRNLSSGSDTESNQSSRASTPCRLARTSRVGFPGFPSFEGAQSASPILSQRQEPLLLSPLTSSRSPNTPKIGADQRLPESRKERVERAISTVISARSARPHDENLLLAGPATATRLKQKKREPCTNAPAAYFSQLPEIRKLFTRRIPELPVLSARSNIYDYDRTVASTFDESSFRRLSKHQAAEKTSKSRTSDNTIKTMFQAERVERETGPPRRSHSESSEKHCPLLGRASADREECQSKDTVMEEMVGNAQENLQVKKAPLTEQTDDETIHALRAVHSERLLGAVSQVGTVALGRSSEKQSKDSENQTNSCSNVNDIEIMQVNSKEVDVVKTSTRGEDIKVPSLALTSRDISNTTTPTNRTYTQSKVLDTRALITALSNVSLRLDTEKADSDSNNICVDSRGTEKLTATPVLSESCTIEERFSETETATSASKKSITLMGGKARSKIPVRTASVKSFKSTLSPESSKYINGGSTFYSAANAYSSESMSIDSNSQTMPNATPVSGAFSFENESKYRQQESEMARIARLPGENESGEGSGGRDGPAASLPSFLNAREWSKQSTARQTENTSQCYSESGSSFEKTRSTRPYTQTQTLETASDNSRYRFKLETPNLSFRTKSDYSKCSDDSRSEDKYQRSLKSEDSESGDAYDDETTVRSELAASRGPLLSHENLLRFNDEECMRLNLSAGREMWSIEELSEKTGLYDEVNPKPDPSDSVTVPSREACSSHYKSTQVPSWHSELHESFRCTENGESSSDEESGESLKAEDEIEDTPRCKNKSLASRDCTPSVRKRIKLDEELAYPLTLANQKNNAEPDNLNKLQFSIERLAAQKFRRSISLEHTTSSNEDNSKYGRCDYRPYSLQCSASTSKLSFNANRMKRLRAQKRSQDRFPFTISEKTSAVSTQMKAATESRHLATMSEKAKSLEKVYKLALHPSITRLASGGLEDSVSEIMHCIAYNHEDEKRGRRLSMRGLVQKFSAKFKRTKKARRKVPFAETNVLYQNQTYQGDSEFNSCSESSLLKGLKPCGNAPADGHANSPDDVSSAICESIPSKAKVIVHSPTPRRYDCDGRWVEPLSISPRDQKSAPTSPQTTATIVENSNRDIKDICAAFFEKEVSGTPESHAPCLLDKGKPGEPAKEAQLTESTSNFAEHPTLSSSRPHSTKTNRDRNASKFDNNSDSETDCLCLRLCQSVCRRSRKKYPSSIKGRGYR